MSGALNDCRHENDLDYQTVLEQGKRPDGEKYRIIEVQCATCGQHGTVTETWSTADEDWLYETEEWEITE